jgi:phage shock protein E
LIDTRTLEEFNAGHMTGAKLVPYDEISTAIGRHVENKDTPILLYCRSGRRAGIAESVLKKQGYSKVYNVGGIPDIIEFVKQHGS